MNEYRSYWNRRVINDRRLKKVFLKAFNVVYDKAIDLKDVPPITFIENTIARNVSNTVNTVFYDGVLRGMNEVQDKYNKPLPVLKTIQKADGTRPIGLKDVLHVGLPGPRVLLERHTVNIVQHTSSGVYDSIQRVIRDSKGAGEDEIGLVARLQELKYTASGRARNAAQTASTQIFNDGSLLGYKKSGVATGKKWVVNLLSNVRPWHRAVDGQERALDDYFYVHGEYLAYPGDQGGSPANTINCHCGVAAIIGRQIVESTIPAGELNGEYANYYQEEPTVMPSATPSTTSPVSGKTGQDLVTEDVLTKDEVVSMKELGGGTTKSFVITMKSGKQGVFKPPPLLSGIMRRGEDKEIAAYEIDRLLGINRVPPTVRRSLKDEWGSLQEWSEGEAYAEWEIKHSPIGGSALANIPEEERLRLSILDYILSTSDRHGGNFLITKEGKIVAIDNAYTLSSDPMNPIYSIIFESNKYGDFREFASTITDHWTKDIVTALHDKLFASGMLAQNEYKNLLARMYLLKTNPSVLRPFQYEPLVKGLVDKNDITVLEEMLKGVLK